MYLNLDLLYNVDNYLFPLFYYKFEYDYGRQVYSPMTKKFVFKDNQDSITYFDFITKKYGNSGSSFNYKIIFIFTENRLNHNGYVFNKCKPFKLNKKDLYFLKSNTRIN